jgi:hypothetical protein
VILTPSIFFAYRKLRCLKINEERGMMSVELVITVKDEEKRRLTREFLVYEAITLTDTDPVIDKCLKEVLDEFKGEPDDIKVKALMVLK